MQYQRITRTNPKSARIEKPWRNRDHFFVLGDPAAGAERHHDDNAVKVDNYGEALDLVRRGFSIRMSDGSSPPSLVVPASLTFEDRPFKRLDELWTYTMPEPPFTESGLDKDLRAALMAHAAEIYWIAGKQAATSFIGFEFEIDEAVEPELLSRINPDCFNLVRVAKVAYESAFRVGCARLISDDDIDELEILLGATFGRFARRYSHPCEQEFSPLARTLLSAYLRWLISEDQLFGDKLDQSAVERLALLAGMTEAAVRNSLAKEKLSALKGKADYPSIIKWLENRRDFVPLREDERVGARATWSALHHIRSEPISEALGKIESAHPKITVGHGHADKAKIEIIALVEQGHDVPPSLLRDFARHYGLMIDTWVFQFPSCLAAYRAQSAPSAAIDVGA